MKDSFVIFSGGKFEFRKGQDIVIKAFRHLQDKYRDVNLITSWFNSWDFSFNTMSMSNYPITQLSDICMSMYGFALERSRLI